MLDKLIQYTILTFVFLFPIFFLPITPDSYEFNKMYLLFITVLVLLLLLTLKAIKSQKKELYFSTFLLPLFLLSGVMVTSLLFQSSNIAAALITPLSTSTIIAGFLLYLFLIPVFHFEKELPRQIFDLLILSAAIISLWTIAIYAGIFPPNRFLPSGSLLSSAMFLSVIAVYLFLRRPITVVTIITFITIITALSLLIFHLLTDQQPLILPFSYGWQIFLETLKNIRTLLLGVGPTNFVTAFTLTKPIAINMTRFWLVTFTTSSSFLLTLATETGVLTAGIYLWILIKTIRLYHVTYHMSLITSLILQLLLPSNMTLFILTIILLAVTSESKIFYTFDLRRLGVFRYLLLVPVLFLIAIVLYFTAPLYFAEIAFKNSLDAIVNKQGTQAYNAQRDALVLNPNLDRYHLAFSQTSLALANSLAGKDLLTDDDKQNIPRLIQQSIDHARSAVLLNKLNTANWESLARTYESLINFAQGSENWAVESYKQKITLDPFSPQSYVSLARLLISLKRNTEAEIYLKQAIQLKNDLASAHYLLGAIYQEDKRYEEAYREMETTLAYLDRTSSHAKKVEKILSDLREQLPKNVTTPPPTLEKTPTLEPQTLEGIESSPFPTISL